MPENAKTKAVEHEPVSDLLDDIAAVQHGNSNPTISDLFDAIGYRGHGPFLIVPALLEITPLGGIPGVPTLLAGIILFFAGQIVLGRNQLWVPGFIAKRPVPDRWIVPFIKKVKPRASRIDQWFEKRWGLFLKPLAIRAGAAACMLITLLVPPLEFLPFASTLPMICIAIFGLALLVRDGAMLLASVTLIVTVLCVVIFLVLPMIFS